MKFIKRRLITLCVFILSCFGKICYEKKYLTGKNFDKHHLSIGWIWILKYWFPQKILGYNRKVPWPVPPYISIAAPHNIFFEPDDMVNFQMIGSYFQAINANITIGSGTLIAPGVGIITTNHDISCVDKHIAGKDIIIGKECWIGMNAVVLPGVILGDHTIVGAGAIVTKSFEEGSCVLAGNPAKIIKKL